MNLQQAYLEWIKHKPFQYSIASREVSYVDNENQNSRNMKTYIEPKHWDGDCCSNSHFFKNAIGHWVSKPDEDVCKRARAWRIYVRIRDGIVVH